MLTLGIDTSDWQGSVALVEEGRVLALRALDRTGRRHARTLAAELKELFVDAGRPIADCGLVGVSLGPGSFTGLRVGVVCAKTFAYATGCRIVGVDTFEAIAARTPEGVSRVQVVGDAQRDEVFLAFYERGTEGWRCTAPVAIRGADDWLNSLEAGDAVAGPWLDRHASRLIRGVPLPETGWRQTADTVARLSAERLFATSNSDDPWTIEPLYVRLSAAEERRLRTVAAAGSLDQPVS